VRKIEESAEMVLHWSNWRRWHQAWARYYHYRRHQRQEVERAAPQTATVERAVVASGAQQHEQTALVWQRLSTLLPPSDRLGRPYEHARRVVFDAIVYVMQTNCGWRNLPSDFPPWQTVYSQLAHWRKTGVWEKIWSGLEQPHPAWQLQL
jgi:transposase